MLYNNYIHLIMLNLSRMMLMSLKFHINQQEYSKIHKIKSKESHKQVNFEIKT